MRRTEKEFRELTKQAGFLILESYPHLLFSRLLSYTKPNKFKMLRNNRRVYFISNKILMRQCCDLPVFLLHSEHFCVKHHPVR